MAETQEPPNRESGIVGPTDAGRSDGSGDRWFVGPTYYTRTQSGRLKGIKKDCLADAQQLPVRSSTGLSGDTLVPDGQTRQLHAESWFSTKSAFTEEPGVNPERSSQATFATATSSRATGRWSSLQRSSIASYFTARFNTTRYLPSRSNVPFR